MADTVTKKKEAEPTVPVEITPPPAAEQPPAPPAATKKRTPPAPPKPPAGPVTMHRTVERTGLEEADDTGRYCRVLKRSYIHGAVHEPGALVPWPKGIDKLGDNLEEYEG